MPRLALVTQPQPAQWSALEREFGDPRDFLDGVELHVGDAIELLSTDEHTPFAVACIYERSAGRAVIETRIGGYRFSSRLHPGMRFRWPVSR